ncbi:MAG: DUF4625 domain-containing protein [Flavobacteriales bacterium]|nr:DUF4625 domain-containing protein [Flavobacteriales bacterium]
MKLFYSIVFVSFLLSSCTKSVNSDSEAPLIDDLSIKDDNSVEKVEYSIKSNINFSARFRDNENLGSYKFDIHFAGDGHKHLAPIEQKKAVNLIDWGFTEYDNFEGTDNTISFSRKVDTEAKAGPYHCVVYATDDAGNYATYKMTKFIVTREDMPTFSMTAPDFSDFSVVAGSSFLLEGSARAKGGLSKLKYIIMRVDLSEEYVLEEDVLISGDKEVVISTTIEIPLGASEGDYFLLLLASDSAGNVGEELNTFTVTR